MFTVTATEGINSIIFMVRFFTLSFSYEWAKGRVDGQTEAEFLEVCKNEAILLTQTEIDSWAQPVPIAI